MSKILSGTLSELPSDLHAPLARYRHRVFVESLQWDLKIAQPGLEYDQFDRSDTTYVVALDAAGAIGGCARLLPTERPYLLGSLFPALFGHQRVPSSSAVWELSRFTTYPAGEETIGRQDAQQRFVELLRGVIQAAIDRGAERLVTFSSPGMERIARGAGLHTHRVGPPQCIDGKPTLAFWIEIDDQTRAAVGLGLATAA